MVPACNSPVGGREYLCAPHCRCTERIWRAARWGNGCHQRAI